MHYYYLKRVEDGAFVSDGRLTTASYTRNIDCAKKYKTREEAERDKCGNEIIVEY